MSTDYFSFAIVIIVITVTSAAAAAGEEQEQSQSSLALGNFWASFIALSLLCAEPRSRGPQRGPFTQFKSSRERMVTAESRSRCTGFLSILL